MVGVSLLRKAGPELEKRFRSSVPCANVHVGPLVHMLFSQNLQMTVL
jgi:hypothetical protein